MTTSPTPTMTLDEFWAIIETQAIEGDPVANEAYNDAIGRFLTKIAARADFVCVYRNEDMGHPELGQLKITSYGSPACQLEEAQFPDGPPSTLPDIGNVINWRYQLVGILAPGAS